MDAYFANDYESSPDLNVASVDGPSSGSPGDTVSITFAVRNRTTVTTSYSEGGPFDIGVYLSSDTDITTSDRRICETIENEIIGGQTKNYTLNCTIPNDVSGTYYWGVIADSGDFVVESNESNNAGYDPTPVIIIPKPSAQITAKSVSYLTIALGQSFTVSVTGKNNGGTAGWGGCQSHFPNLSPQAAVLEAATREVRPQFLEQVVDCP